MTLLVSPGGIIVCTFLHPPMQMQDLFDVAYSVSLAGVENEYQLCRTFFMRSGKRASFQTLRTIYEKMKRIVGDRGYSDPLDYLEDFFPNERYERMKIFRSSLELNVKIALEKKVEAGGEPEAPKKEELAVLKVEPSVSEPEEARMQIRIKSDAKKSNEAAVEIPPRDKAKILRYKKASKKYKEMDQKEKEIDNRYDYFVVQSRMDETGKRFTDNRACLDKNPFMQQFFGDLDIEFRKVMFKIYRHDRSKTKDKSRYKEDMEFLESYFAKKLRISRSEEGGVKKLANAIAYLMKKLQHKIFETDDRGIIESMLHLKSKLCQFYNFYKK